MRKLFTACIGCACLLIASSAMADNGQTQRGKGSEQEQQQAMLMVIKALMKLGSQGEKVKNQMVQEYIATYGFDQLPDNSFDNLDPNGNGEILFPSIGVDGWENGGDSNIEFN